MVEIIGKQRRMNQGPPGKSQAAACNLFSNDIAQSLGTESINHLPRWEP
ncbi:hypothetical protein LEMLEM_LOCUS7973, partial [Lemmus lemmus]